MKDSFCNLRDWISGSSSVSNNDASRGRCSIFETVSSWARTVGIAWDDLSHQVLRGRSSRVHNSKWHGQRCFPYAPMVCWRPKGIAGINNDRVFAHVTQPDLHDDRGQRFGNRGYKPFNNQRCLPVPHPFRSLWLVQRVNEPNLVGRRKPESVHIRTCAERDAKRAVERVFVRQSPRHI